MSRSLSWFDDEDLRKMFAGAGAPVRSRRGIRGRSVVVASSGPVPDTLKGQFGHGNRFSAMTDVDQGRFVGAAATKAGPPDIAERTAQQVAEQAAERFKKGTRPGGFNPKTTQLTAGAALPAGKSRGSGPPVAVAVGASTKASMPPLGDPSALFSPRSDAGIEARVNAYLEWVLKVCDARAGFVVDRDGLPLAEAGNVGDSADEVCALCAAVDRGWSLMLGVEPRTPDGYAIVQRGDSSSAAPGRGWVLLTWTSVSRPGASVRLYAALLVETVPAQAAVTLASEAFRSLFARASSP